MLADPGREADRVVAEDEAGALGNGANVRLGNLSLAGWAVYIVSFGGDDHLSLLSFGGARDYTKIEVRKDLRDMIPIEEDDFCLVRHRERRPHYTSLQVPFPVIGPFLAWGSLRGYYNLSQPDCQPISGGSVGGIAQQMCPD